MPLPQALLARLKKRGLIKNDGKEKKSDEVEEVFAEDYDEPAEQPVPGKEKEEEQDQQLQQILHTEVNFASTNEPVVHETLACPNRSNPFHSCVDYCHKRWGVKRFLPDPDMERRRNRMLQKYPLPDEWQEVADPETNRYYYWNTITDQVSWLSPIHPRAKISVSTDKLIAVLGKNAVVKLPAETDNNVGSDMEEDDEDGFSASDLDDDDLDDEERKIVEREREREKRKERKESIKARARYEELDPMDPASYSDAPRGTWSTGLDRRGEAKTGADVTASGPLYQQRPYPSPGEVLRMNRQLDDQRKT